MDPMARPLGSSSRLFLAVVALHLILNTAALELAIATPIPTITPTTAPVWATSGQIGGEDFGTSVAAAGDLNGDGYGDVVIGAPCWGVGSGCRGRALVFLGARVGLSMEPAWTIEGSNEEATLGLSVSGAGDVNGDNYSDVIIGEPGFSGGAPYRGRARIIPGSRHGLRLARAWEITGETEGEGFGGTVTSAGDVNGDGYDDVLIGSISRTVLFLGRPGGIERRAEWTGPHCLAPIGVRDVDGDGYDDVVLVGGPETLLYLGSSTGLSTVPTWRGPTALSGAGGGDVNGDGYADLVLGPPEFPGNLVRLFLGSPRGLSLTPAWEARDSGLGGGGSWFGLSVATGGDVNYDGYADILVSAPHHVESSQFKPSVFVYLGSRMGPSQAPDWTASDGAPGGFGWSVALGADVDGDGASEVLVGDPRARVGAVNPGRATLYSLGAAYPAPAVVHEPVLIATEGMPIVVEAAVMDRTNYVARAEIVCSIGDSEPRTSVAMERLDGDHFRGTIPGELALSGLTYFIRAFDNYGLVSQTTLIGVDFILAAGSAGLAAVFEVQLLPGRISFTTSRPGPVRVRLFDVRGRLVSSLVDAGIFGAGTHSVPISGAGLRRASGVYFYRVETVDGRRSGRLVLPR